MFSKALEKLDKIVHGGVESKLSFLLSKVVGHCYFSIRHNLIQLIQGQMHDD